MLRRLLLVLLVLVMLGGVAAWRVLAPGPELDVVSIATLPTYQDPALLARAWQLPVAALYASKMLAQTNPSYCGPTSLAVIENSVRHDAITPDGALAGTGLCRTGLCFGGLTLDEVAATARGLGHDARAVRNLSLAEFRDEMRRTNDRSRRYLINFHRAPLFRKGGGHHSPIGGYLETEDLVFVLDVNRNFGPWLVPTERLWRAMTTIDSSTSQQRGLVVYAD